MNTNYLSVSHIDTVAIWYIILLSDMILGFLALNGSAYIKYTQKLMAVYTANTPLFTKQKWHCYRR